MVSTNFFEAESPLFTPLIQKYPGRMRIMLTGIPKERLTNKLIKENKGISTQDYQFADSLVKIGQFTQALVYFQQSVYEKKV